jgi:CubicO group peptidase (beta-lactamase class C family)
MLRSRIATPLSAAVCLTVIAVVTPAARQTATPPNFAAVEAAVRAELKQTQAPGAAIAVVSGDRVVYTRAFGVANTETGEEMRPEMLFRLGSTTKMFTAAAVVLLAEQGKLNLTEPIGRHIPGLTPKLAALTAHHLLSHTSGILDEAPMFGSHDDEAMREEVGRWTDSRFFAEPDQVYSYSNPGYWLAGLLAETVGAQPFADQVASTIFTPLGMTRSTFRPTMAMTYPLAQGHDLVGGQMRIIRPAANNSASWPAGSIFSNVIDLSRWLTAFVNQGRIGGDQVLPVSLFATLSTPRASIPGATNRYGYGVQVGEWRGLQVVEHGGSRSGYGSVIRMVPSRQFGVVVLANRTGVSLTRTANAAIEAVLAPPPAPAAARTTPLPDTDAERRRYQGRYSQGGREMTVEAKGASLVLRQGTRETPLEKVGEHEFLAGTTRYVFVTNTAGTVTFLHSGGRSWRRVQ